MGDSEFEPSRHANAFPEDLPGAPCSTAASEIFCALSSRMTAAQTRAESKVRLGQYDVASIRRPGARKISELRLCSRMH